MRNHRDALVFHEHIAGMHENIRPLARVCGPSVVNPQARVLSAWDTILDINYWAIFAIAKDILESLDCIWQRRGGKLGCRTSCRLLSCSDCVCSGQLNATASRGRSLPGSQNGSVK